MRGWDETVSRHNALAGRPIIGRKTGVETVSLPIKPGQACPPMLCGGNVPAILERNGGVSGDRPNGTDDVSIRLDQREKSIMGVFKIYILALVGAAVGFLYVFFNRFTFFRRHPVGCMIPVIVALGGVAIVVYAHVLLSRLVGISEIPLLRAIGIFFFASALITYALCWELAFFAKPEGVYSKELYCKGIYALCRNPQALALSLAVTGQVFYVAKYPMWGLCILNLGFLYAYTIAEEKLEMEPRFGELFKEYKKEVPRLIPDLKSIKQCIRTFGGR